MIDADRPENLLALLARTPDREAFRDEREVLTYGETCDLVYRFARALRRAGVGPGSVVALGVPLRGLVFPLCYAINLLGAGHLNLPVWLEPGAVPVDALRGVRADAVVFDAEDANCDSRVAGLVKVLTEPDGVASLSLGPCAGATDLWAAALSESPEPFAAVGARPDDPKAMWLTGGTTGGLKWAAFPFATRRPALFGSYAGAGGPMRPLVAYRLGPVPYGLAAVTLARGGTVVTRQELDPAGLAQILVSERITEVNLFPHSWRRMLVVPEAQQAPVTPEGLRRISLLGDCGSAALMSRVIARFGPIVHKRYGQNEAGLVAELTPDDYAGRPERLRSCGRAVPGVELAIRDRGGRELGAGRRGELWVRGPGVMSGYWRRPGLSARALRDGWLRTDDAAVLDEDGYLRVLGRMVDTVSAGGRMVGPADVEGCLEEHPSVAASAMFTTGGTSRAARVAWAAVVAEPGDVSPQELSRQVFEGAGIRIPAQRFRFVPDIPVAASGKSDRRVLATRFGPSQADRRGAAR